jgi:uncharacterized membrane protein YhaH (DUF805 family)
MKEILFIIFCVGLYVFGSFRLHRLLLKTGSFFFLILSASYIVCSFYLFTVIVYMEQVFDPKGLRFNFGHDSSMLVMMLFVWMLIAFVNIIVVCVRRFRKN